MGMEIKHIVVPFKLSKMDDQMDQMGEVSGYGSVFNNIDLGSDIILNSAFDQTLAEWKGQEELPQMLGFHRDGNLVGDWLEMGVDEYGLKVKGRLWVKGERRIEEAVKCYNLVKGTGPKGLSIGYSIDKYHYEEREGKEVRIIEALKLYEVSIVGFAMNPSAKVTHVKNLTDEDGQILDKRTVERALRDAGLSRRQSKAFLAGGYDALARDEQSRVEAEERDASLDESGVLASLKSLTSKMEHL